ncbi:MAG: hypothetical protein IPK82_26625 [Polyangiaceae bacterium]|nr:hypothetical protein [Polyangiaceae bacterium]
MKHNPGDRTAQRAAECLNAAFNNNAAYLRPRCLTERPLHVQPVSAEPIPVGTTTSEPGADALEPGGEPAEPGDLHFFHGESPFGAGDFAFLQGSDPSDGGDRRFRHGGSLGRRHLLNDRVLW